MLHTENGMLGMGPRPRRRRIDPDLINAGKIPVTELPGASYFHHADSFAMMRGGHLDVCVLGAFQVSATGDLANWHTGSPDAIPAVGGAMDLAIGAKQTLRDDDPADQDGGPKLVRSAPIRSPGSAASPGSTPTWRSSSSQPDGVAVRDLFGVDFGHAQHKRPRPAHRPNAEGKPVTGSVTSYDCRHRRAGPAGLMLSHLLSWPGIDSVVVDNRTGRDRAHRTSGHPRAGQRPAARRHRRLRPGAPRRSRARGHRPAFGGESHRIDFQELVGASVWLYPQTDVFVDLARRARDGTAATYGSASRTPRWSTSRRPRPGILFTDADGRRSEIRCDYLVGADGSRSICRSRDPESLRDATTSGSTRSPGSASCARRRRARPS